MSSETDRIREKLSVPYRIVCPAGHTRLTAAETTRTAYCQSCGRSYPFDELVDRRLSDDADRHS